MALYRHILLSSLLILVSLSMGCASTPTQEGTGEYIDDSILTTKVSAALLQEPTLKSAEINVETFKGVVQLSGFVSSRAAINTAVDVARKVQGVKTVRNTTCASRDNSSHARTPKQPGPSPRRPQFLGGIGMMKHLVLVALALAGLNTAAMAAGPNTYQCIRPDGTVVCTINAQSGDPSTICNHDCPDCNMTCAARQHVVRDGNELIFNPGASAPVQPKRSGPKRAETPRYCKQQYQKCESRCKSNRNNRTQEDVDACISGCSSTYSGCGTQP